MFISTVKEYSSIKGLHVDFPQILWNSETDGLSRDHGLAGMLEALDLGSVKNVSHF